MRGKVNIMGLDVNVVSNEEIVESGMPHIAVRLQDARQPLDEHYTPGTKAGYICAACGSECILAPSGQAIAARGKNPIICLPCFLAHKEA